MKPIVLEGLRKVYGSTVAVDSISLRIEAGELFFLLGPSGCGKTTLLRMIAGFVQPTRGRVRLGDKDVTDLPPEKRNTGMVFQNYALWPHMNVAQNVAFGLSVRGFKRAQRNRLVDEVLATVHMGEYARRKPNELSGGQQQRVALARALVIKPAVLLLDEPLSNLDAKLRMEMRSEIRRICTETGVTTIYVTHDQKEALSMADSVAVLRAGLAVQVGTPQQLYKRPTHRFVADFLGETNFISAEVADAESGKLILNWPVGTIQSSAFDDTTPRSGNVTCSIRPESWKLRLCARNVSDPTGDASASGTQQSAADDHRVVNQWVGTVVESTYLGEMAQHFVQLDNEVRIRVYELNPRDIAPGKSVSVSVDPRDVVVLND